MTKSKVSKIEFCSFIILIGLGVAWMIKPDSNIEPFFAFISLVFVGSELMRRGAFRKIRRNRIKQEPILSPLEVPDDVFELLAKISKLNLLNEVYHPETPNEQQLCISMVNQGFFIVEENHFLMTDKCINFLNGFT